MWHLREYGFEFAAADFYVRRQFHKAASVIVVSRAVYDYYVNKYKFCLSDKTRIIYDGLKIPEAYVKEYNRFGNVNFCITGFVHDNKNQLMALRACEKLKASNDKFILHIIGAGDEEYISELNNIISVNNLHQNIKFRGFRYDVREILRNMDIGLTLSKREAFGRVTVEYMLNYMPVIGTNTGGTPEIIIDSENGFICALDDTEHLVELMYKFITDPKLIKLMGTNARKKAVENFSLEKNTDEIYEPRREHSRL